MKIDPKVQKVGYVTHHDDSVTVQVVPADDLQIQVLRRRLAGMPADHPKRAKYQAQLEDLTGGRGSQV
jgi:hypothetical protein